MCQEWKWALLWGADNLSWKMTATNINCTMQMKQDYIRSPSYTPCQPKNKEATQEWRQASYRSLCSYAPYANGCHKIKLMVVGTAKPLALRLCMDHLPVSWRANKMAWFTHDIWEWFHNVFVPSVCNFQIQKMGVSRDEVKVMPTPARRTYRALMAWSK